MRRSELLGLRWDDIDLKKARVSVNRGLVAVAHELREPRGKTPNSRRSIDLDSTTVRVLQAWRNWQRAEREVAGVKSEDWVFTNREGKPVHPQSISQTFERIAARAGVPRIRLHDVRHTHGTLLIKAGVPVKVVSERLVTGTPRSPSTPTSTCSPVCKPKPPEPSSSSSKRTHPGPPVEGPHNTVEALADEPPARAFRSGGGI